MIYDLSHRLKEYAIDLLFPPQCVGCGSVGHYLCSQCNRSLPRIQPPLCPHCGKPQPREGLCPGCWGWQAAIDGIRAPFYFDGVIRDAIHSFKYRNLRALARPLAGFLADYLKSDHIMGDVLVAVPLHRSRLRERGYNQSALLVTELCKRTGIPEERGLLTRHQDTPPQARIGSADLRRQNVTDVFSCTDKRFKGRRVLIVDDVCTSGATLDSCATALNGQGRFRSGD
ncbi:ComF family protein [Chloroflexota bacterium]